VYDHGRSIGMPVVRPFKSFWKMPDDVDLPASFVSGIGFAGGPSGGGLVLSAGFCTCVEPLPGAAPLLSSVGWPVETGLPLAGVLKITGPGDGAVLPP
jgi:hypothetical protein